jgi:DNA repair exonuclease SbcCD ATPase subunit
MHATHSSANSNILYETKKSSLSRPGAEEPPSELYQNPKKEIEELRAQLRRRDTDIIRLKSKIDDLTKELRNSQEASKTASKAMFEYDKKVADDTGKINFIADNKQLRDENDRLGK